MSGFHPWTGRIFSGRLLQFVPDKEITVVSVLGPAPKLFSELTCGDFSFAANGRDIGEFGGNQT